MRSKVLTRLLFLIYLLLLTWVILFKMNLSGTIDSIDISASSSINLIPFAGTAVYNGQLDFMEIGLNILFFIPYGVCLRTLNRDDFWLTDLFKIIFTSLVFEILQYILSIGVTDITDLLANSLGGLVGMILFAIIQKINEENTVSFVNKVGILGMIAVFIYLKFWY